MMVEGHFNDGGQEMILWQQLDDVGPITMIKMQANNDNWVLVQ